MKSLKTYKFHQKFHVLSDLRMCANHPEYSIRLLYSFSLRGQLKTKGIHQVPQPLCFIFTAVMLCQRSWYYHGDTTVKL